MKLQEYQAKEIFKKYGIPIQSGFVAETAEEAKNIAQVLGKPVVIKAQVLVGGRGKAGGIKIAENPEDAQSLAQKILGMEIKGEKVKKVLVAEAVEIEKEYYASIIIDRNNRTFSALVSSLGGMDIEEVAEKSPEKISYVKIDSFLGLRDFQIRELFFGAGLSRKYFNEISKIILNLYKIFRENYAQLIEINPLAITKEEKILAVDAKIILDDNAIFLIPEGQRYAEEEEMLPLEAEAKKRKLPYVKLKGDIGIIGNGAGLVMATMDLVKFYGGRPANFLDFGAGARAEIIKNAVELVLMDKDVKGLLINIFGGLTRGDEVAKGIISATKDMSIKIPIVIRLAGTKAEEGLDLLKDVDYLTPAKSMKEAAQKIVELVS